MDVERDGVVLAQGQKIIYGRPLFYEIMDDRFPEDPILPLDESGETDVVNWATLEETVFLFVPTLDDLEGGEDDAGD
jgi:hypothetical protein